MVASTHIQPTHPTLSESPIDSRMDIELNSSSDNGYSSGGFGSRDSVGALRFRLSQPCDEVVDSSATGQLIRELQQHINDLQARIECLEDRLPSRHHAVPAFNTNVEPDLMHDVFDDPDEVVGAEPTAPEYSGQKLSDLPRGPLSIDVVATALGKKVRTIRGWCQVEKYEIPAHKEAGYWCFYRDELVVWYADFETISRRDAKRAQAKRRKTKHGNQGV